MIDRIVEDSYYDHDWWGRVKVVSVDATTVAFQIVDENTRLSSMDAILKGKYEKVSKFKEQATPANVTVEADAAVLDLGAFEAQ